MKFHVVANGLGLHGEAILSEGLIVYPIAKRLKEVEAEMEGKSRMASGYHELNQQREFLANLITNTLRNRENVLD